MEEPQRLVPSSHIPPVIIQHPAPSSHPCWSFPAASQPSTLVAPMRSHMISSVYIGLLTVIINNMKLGTRLTGQTLAVQQAALQHSQQPEQGIKHQLLPISVPDKAPKITASITACKKGFFFLFFLIISFTWPFLPERLE